MTAATYRISAFGDEIDPDLDNQLATLRDLYIGYLDLRAAWGKNVVDMDAADMAHVAATCERHGVQVACIGSPIGKSPILDPIEREIENLRKIFRVGEAVSCRRIRMFSFYPPDTSTNENYDAYVEMSVERLEKLAELAERAGFMLLLENEKGIVTDTLARCETVVREVSSPALRFLWDSANFVQVGEAQVAERGWPMVGDLIAYVHIKDAVLGDGHVVPAGEGDGQLRELLGKLNARNYQGFLALEPHLKVAGHSTGFSGAEGMRIAVTALRGLMAEVGCDELGA
jgi:sugar phosphate isomerase/epimerase